MKLNKNKIWAGIAMILGIIAIIAGNPTYSNSEIEEASVIPIALNIKTISVMELADWIVQGKTGYRVFDIRSEKDYAVSRIHVAENYPITELQKLSGKDKYEDFLATSETVVIYCRELNKAKKAFALLSIKNYKSVYVLEGGIEKWNNEIMNPVIPENATKDDIAEFNNIKHISRFFGGKPVGDTEELAAPAFSAPAPPVAAPVSKKKKPKKEGCS